MFCKHYSICDWCRMLIFSAAYMAWIVDGLAKVHARLYKKKKNILKKKEEEEKRKNNNKKINGKQGNR